MWEAGPREHLMVLQSNPTPVASFDSRSVSDTPHPPPNRRRGLQGASGIVLLALMGELLEATDFLPLEQTLGSK